jgi:hypothetical protein
VADVADVREWIGVEHEQIGDGPRGDGAGAVEAHRPGAVPRRGDEHVARREPRRLHRLELHEHRRAVQGQRVAGIGAERDGDAGGEDRLQVGGAQRARLGDAPGAIPLGRGVGALPRRDGVGGERLGARSGIDALERLAVALEAARGNLAVAVEHGERGHVRRTRGAGEPDELVVHRRRPHGMHEDLRPRP